MIDTKNNANPNNKNNVVCLWTTIFLNENVGTLLIKRIEAMTTK